MMELLEGIKIIKDAPSVQQEPIPQKRFSKLLPCQRSASALLQSTRRSLPARIFREQSQPKAHQPHGPALLSEQRMPLPLAQTHQLQQVPQTQPPRCASLPLLQEERRTIAQGEQQQFQRCYELERINTQLVVQKDVSWAVDEQG